MNNKIKKIATLTIDRKASAKNGRELCEQIAPIIQMRRNQKQSDIISSSSLIKVIENESVKSRLEQVVLERIEWESDPVTWFVQKLQEIKEEHPIEGEYLLYTYYFDMSDIEYCYTYNVKERTMQRIKNEAHIYVAIKTGYHVYKYKNVLEVNINSET